MVAPSIRCPSPSPKRRWLPVALALAALSVGVGEAAAQAARDFRKNCAADIEKFCAGIEPGGGRVMQCLQQHAAELSPACRSTYDAASQKLKERRG